MYELDLRGHPIVVVRMRGKASEGDLEVFLGEVDAALASTDGPFALINVVGAVSRTSPEQNAAMRSWYARQEETIRTRCAGVAFSIGRVSWRVLARAALSRRPPPFPHMVCAREAEAKSWCADRLARL